MSEKSIKYPDEKNDIMSDFLSGSISGLGESGIREFCRRASEKEDCINLTIGEPDFETDLRIIRTAYRALKGGCTHYPPNNGYLFLREAVADYERKINGYDYSAEEVIITAGATEALYIALRSVLEAGDEVVIPVPAFGLYESIVKSCGGVCRVVNTEKRNFQLCADMLEEVINGKTKAVILNSPNNPTGAVYSRKNLEEIAELLKRYNIFVICDDVYQRIFFHEDGEERCMGFAKFSELRDRIIVVQSFSKTYAMTGWRAGYVMADRLVSRVMSKLHRNLIVSVASFVQFGCAEALDEIHEKGILCMRETYRRRRDFLCSRLKKMGIDVVTPMGGFYAFPKLGAAGGSERICAELIEKAGVAFTPGKFFGCDGYARISFCYPDSILEEGMNRLESYMAEQKGAGISR